MCFPDKNITYPLTSDQILNGEPSTKLWIQF
jgi:hypothetical protein